MNPSFDLRLQAMIRVMEVSVIPAVQDAMASHLAGLVTAHMKVLKDQLDHGARYDALEFKAALPMAQTLLNITGDCADLAREHSALRDAARQEEAADPAAARLRLRILDEACEQLLESAMAAGSKVLPVMRETVLQHSRGREMRARSFFVGMGFEPEPVASIEDMLSALESATSSESAA